MIFVALRFIFPMFYFGKSHKERNNAKSCWHKIKLCRFFLESMVLALAFRKVKVKVTDLIGIVWKLWKLLVMLSRDHTKMYFTCSGVETGDSGGSVYRGHPASYWGLRATIAVTWVTKMSEMIHLHSAHTICHSSKGHLKTSKLLAAGALPCNGQVGMWRPILWTSK